MNDCFSSFFNKYPYTNYHELNLDFIMKNVDELNNKVDNILDKKIDEYIQSMFDKIMIDAIYSEETETIVLKKGLL